MALNVNECHYCILKTWTWQKTFIKLFMVFFIALNLYSLIVYIVSVWNVYQYCLTTMKSVHLRSDYYKNKGANLHTIELQRFSRNLLFKLMPVNLNPQPLRVITEKYAALIWIKSQRKYLTSYDKIYKKNSILSLIWLTLTLIWLSYGRPTVK